MKKTQVSQITHFAEYTREVPSSERTLDTTPIIPNPQDQDKPQGPADTSPVTSTGQGIQSMPASRFLCTKPSPPGEIKIDSVEIDYVSLSWDSPVGIDGIPHSFKITFCSSDKSHQDEAIAPSNSTVISKLRPGREYSFTVTTVLENGTQSTPVSTSVCTKTLQKYLHDLGLDQNFKTKLTLSDVLQIGTGSITEEPILSAKSLPHSFLKTLMMVNVKARSIRCSAAESETNTASSDFKISDIMADNDNDEDNVINPLDLITAVLLCTDSFLQQEIMSKMSMCQFAVPLLLPNCDTNQCTLMLWAMRDIVKEWRPSSLPETKGFVENSIVSTAMPLISFVRLGDCSLSKSQILNQVLSNPHQYHDIFVHRNMDCGDVRRRISNGLAEISWYLPCGNKNIDVFPEPLSIANIRGDVSSFQTQFCFLMQSSAAVFLFFDNIGETEYKLLVSLKTIKDRLFLVFNSEVTLKQETLKHMDQIKSELQLQKRQFLVKNRKINDADFVKKLRSTVESIIRNRPHKIKIEDMTAIAKEFGIAIDEESTECQTGKQCAAAITAKIDNVLLFKKKQLPLQDEDWKKLAKLEKEECRLRKAGEKRIEDYKCQLQKEIKELREKQNKHDLTEAMKCFICAISNSNKERSFFLKWLKLKLDDKAREKLSDLRNQYKELCNADHLRENKIKITELDQQISNSSLGIEHFMREIGQIYEAAWAKGSHQQFQYLSSLGADLLLDGFPLELLDGDASNIPVRWVTDVLTKLHEKVQRKSRVLVVTVLGVQSTGKSTLLNTMFGVQFAVSSSRCTRGAFMLLIRVKEDLKEELNCDFILVIDTEGLKSPELAELEDSYEHDNELATLVIGLSDITIINVSMGNSIEMKDILQIVVHAFLRMKEVGKKPNCQFVHQNVGNVSAHDNNARDRKKLLQQLNEMIQVAARMEKLDPNIQFTDVVEYDPKHSNWYISGLWNGVTPMAPVNTGYSEAVYEFKKSLIEVLKSCNDQKPPAQITEFMEWVKSLWKAVKYENFIFSFKNSLVAEAYSNLCVEYGKWEWDFQKHMYNWLATAETRISNTKNKSSNLDEFLNRLQDELESQENTTLDKLTKYYESKDGHVNLVESYRATFEISIKTLRTEIENSVTNKLTAAIDFQKGMKKVHDAYGKHKAILEERVLKLLGDCRNINEGLSEEQLKKEFEKMWEETVKGLDFKDLEKRDIVSDVYNQLRKQLKTHAVSVNMVLNEATDLIEYGKTHFNVTDGHFDRAWYKKHLSDNMHLSTHPKEEAEAWVKSITEQCTAFVSHKKSSKTDYHETYTRELLDMLDVKLKEIKKLNTNTQFAVDLKLHICGFAAREFQQMHTHFIVVNDPRKHLENSRQQYCSDFTDLYHEKDQSLKKAEEFTERCLKPAVREYVNKALGIDIQDEMLTGADSVKYSTRSYFQHSILREFLEENHFNNFYFYCTDYEGFVKGWILNRIIDQFSNSKALSDLEVKRFEVITKKIQGAIEKEKNKTLTKSETIFMFVKNICSNLNSDIVISTDNLGLTLIQDKANTDEFTGYLQDCVNDMKKSLSAEFSQGCDIKKKLNSLPYKPQDELFKRVFGCGKLCPFCKVPCEAGGQDHKEHHASVHRPKGLGMYKYERSGKLVETICTSDVYSESTFQNSDTEWKFHPCKGYRKFYPDWNIAPDPSIEASDYWKYVLMKFNEKFAEVYEAKPADAPAEWRKITKERALKSINEVYNMK